MGKQVKLQMAADSGGVHPDELMGDVSKSTLSKTLPVSLAAHLIVISLTSIGFVYQCVKYGSFYPRAAQRRIDEEKQTAEENRKRDEYIKKLAEKEKDRKAIAATAATQPATGRERMEKKLSETIVPTQPVKPTINIDEDLE